MNSEKVTLPGSERQPAGTRVGDQPGDEKIEISVILRPKERLPVPLKGGAAVSREEFAAKYGADPESIDLIKQFAEANGLTVTDVSAARRTVKLEGPAAAMIQAFEVQLGRYEHNGRQYRARTGGIQIPAGLAQSVEAILGLDNRPQAEAHFRVNGAAAAAAGVSYTPRQVAELYQFPLDVDGTGQTVGILELGGGYMPADLKNYFASLGVEEPNVISVSVDKAQNQPTNPNSSDAEVLLDIEVVGAVAPGTKIVVYFAPNTDQGFQDALTTAIHDATNNPSIDFDQLGRRRIHLDGPGDDGVRFGRAGRSRAGRDDLRRLGRQRVQRWSQRRRQSCGFPGLQPAHSGAAGAPALKSANGAITSETVWNDGDPGRRQRGRVQRAVSTAFVAGRGEHPTAHGRWAWCAGRGRRCGPRNRLQRAGGRGFAGDRGNQRGGAAVERADRAAEREAGKTGGLSAAGTLRTARGGGRFPRHYQRIERSVFGGSRMGRYHGAGVSRGREFGSGIVRNRIDRFQSLNGGSSVSAA